MEAAFGEPLAGGEPEIAEGVITRGRLGVLGGAKG
jgi:hypothetical protein